MVTIPELRVPGEGGDDPGEALEADGVRAGKQLGHVLLPVEHACDSLLS